MSLDELKLKVFTLAAERKLSFNLEFIGITSIRVGVLIESHQKLIGWLTFHTDFSLRSQLVFKQFQRDHIVDHPEGSRLNLEDSELVELLGDPQVWLKNNRHIYELEAFL